MLLHCYKYIKFKIQHTICQINLLQKKFDCLNFGVNPGCFPEEKNLFFFLPATSFWGVFITFSDSNSNTHTKATEKTHKQTYNHVMKQNEA